MLVHPQYITDSVGSKLVVLPIEEFNTIMEELEELEDIRLYDKATASDEPSVPIDEAFKIIEEVIPEWQRAEILKRSQEIKEHPESVVEWNDAIIAIRQYTE